MQKIKVIARDSKLSQIQFREVADLLPGIGFEPLFVRSFGDKHKEISLLDNPASDIFTRELDTALLNGTADIAVHSAKDLPFPMPAGIKTIALTKGLSKTDSLVSLKGYDIQNLPFGATVGTSSQQRKLQLLQLRSDLTIVSIRGTIEERIAQIVPGKIDAVIVATCALERLGLLNENSVVLPFETHPWQGNLAVTAAAHRYDLVELFKEIDIRKKYGKVYLTGFGPGNPELMTLKAHKVIQTADTIFFDDLTNPGFLNKLKTEIHYVGKRKDRHYASQDTINELLYKAASSGKTVVRLKGGDPMVFGRAGEEIEYLMQRGVTVEVIPGITTAIATAAETGLPLTQRGKASSLLFSTAHSPESIQVQKDATNVYYMGASNLHAVSEKLVNEGLDKENGVLMARNVSLPDQHFEYTSVNEMGQFPTDLSTPMLTIAGKVVDTDLASHFATQQPVILVTGTNAERCSRFGKVIHTPLIAFEQVSETDKNILMVFHNLKSFDWIVFPSKQSVYYFFNHLNAIGSDSRMLSGLLVAAIGKSTAVELNKHGITADFIPSKAYGKNMVSEISKVHPISGKKILIPCSNISLPYLVDGLKESGGNVTSIVLYQTTVASNFTKVNLETFNYIHVSSPSCFEALLKIYSKIPKHLGFIAIGETTSDAIRSSGLLNRVLLEDEL